MQDVDKNISYLWFLSGAWTFLQTAQFYNRAMDVLKCPFCFSERFIKICHNSNPETEGEYTIKTFCSACNLLCAEHEIIEI